MRVARLRCEHREDIPCVDHPAPRLGWILESGRRDERQTAYRVLVARDPVDLAAGRGTLWDSGRVASDRTVDVAYAGRPLPPAAELVWAVRVWDADGVASDWSEAARFRTGPAAWQARWIRRDPAEDPFYPVPAGAAVEVLERGRSPVSHLRRRFAAGPDVRRATLYATARGVVELQLNGERVGDAVLAPGWTDYRARIEYAAHDVTALVRAGENVVGAILGEGWYAGHVGFNPKRQGNWYGDRPELLCELHLEHADGSVEVIATDGGWRATGDGPIRSADLLHGERYDARLELDGWSAPGFDDAAWPPVLARERDGVRLVPERGQPMRVTEDVPAVAVSSPRPGVHVFDLGQNLVGWVRLAVVGRRRDGGAAAVRRDARAGRHAVHRQPAARARRGHLRAARRRAEVHEPRFTSTASATSRSAGCRRPRRSTAITGRVVHSDTPVERDVRVLARRGRPARLEHRLGPARQLRLGADRLPAARRAARLARRRPGVPPDRDAVHGRRRVHDEVGRRRPRRPVRRGRLSRRRPAAGRRARRRARLGGRGRDRPVGGLPALRRPAAARAPLAAHGALHGPPAPPQPRPAVAGAPQQRLRRLALGRRRTRRARCSPPRTSPTTRS